MLTLDELEALCESLDRSMGQALREGTKPGLGFAFLKGVQSGAAAAITSGNVADALREIGRYMDIALVELHDEYAESKEGRLDAAAIGWTKRTVS